MLVSLASRMGLQAADEGFNPPNAGDFNLPPFIEGNQFATKPIALIFFSVLLMSIFFIIAFQGFDALHVVPDIFYGALNDFTLVSIPMFVMMGAAIGSSICCPLWQSASVRMISLLRG